MKARYGGTIGKTQGDIKLKNPAKKQKNIEKPKLELIKLISFIVKLPT
tara:strand:+ start:551 stop:694 length:144 start_codon:yes stop_codon:yes gene_type:complete